MTVTASTLRNNIYKLLDETLTTGKPLDINRKGKKLKIVRVDNCSKISRLSKHKCIVGDPTELIHNDWSGEWKNDLP
jgi:methyl coenzyme M reductase gamma subunit